MGHDCVLCAARSPSLMVCADCVASLPRFDEQVLRGKAHYDAVVAAYEYRFPLDRLVQRFKYAGDLAVGRWLALELARRVRDERRPELLVPMPLTTARLRERGFNQAAQIARVVSRSLGVPVALRLVERVRDAPSQSGLGRRARRANLRGAFRCRAPLRGRRVVLVDDVITTGASADAVCAVLKRAGASRVDVWALARTPEPGAR
ncbi:MAG TPA: ComF family protein [Usitatibacter sp.]|nr:ComF family protein [Usitatibacter sp.]